MALNCYANFPLDSGRLLLRWAQMNPWRQELEAAAQHATARVVGERDAENEAQARVVLAFIEQYGYNLDTRLYIEPSTARSTHRPPDLVLVDQSTGVLVVEVKSYSIDAIERLEAGSFYLRSDGFPKPRNPFKQVQNVLFDDIRDPTLRIIGDPYDMPLFGYTIAFPNITEAEWRGRGFHRALPSHQILFKEHVQDSSLLLERIADLTTERLERARLRCPLTPSQASAVYKVFGDSAVINEVREARMGVSENTLGAVLDELAVAEKRLSDEQQALSMLKLAGSPRLVRGVAGSGKTVVLANLVARYIKQRLAEPIDMFAVKELEPLKVAVVCFNRALVQMLHQKVEAAFLQQTGKPLPKDVLLITHFQTLLYRHAEQGAWKYQSVKQGTAEERAKSYRKDWADPARGNRPVYDAIFVDEGQDIEPEEYGLLSDLVRPHEKSGEKNLIVFYDDAQNLYAKPRPNWRSLGIEMVGRSHVMKTCFRNTRDIVELAFNVLLGSAAPDELKVRTRTYADVDYLKRAELIVERDTHMEVRFAERSFHRPNVQCFGSREDERAWVATKIVGLIQEERVRPEDILVIFKQPRSFGHLELLTLLRERLSEEELTGFMQPYFAGVEEHRDEYIFKPKHLTLATPNAAKGYDAHVVFLVGADLFPAEGDENAGRAAFYVAATRAKNVLYVSGVASGEHNLLNEAQGVARLLWGGGVEAN